MGGRGVPERTGAARDFCRLVACTVCRMSSLLKKYLASNPCNVLQLPRRQTGADLHGWLVKAFLLFTCEYWPAMACCPAGREPAVRKLQRNPLAHLQEVACAVYIP